MEKQSQETNNSSTEPPSQSLPLSEGSEHIVSNIQNGIGFSLTSLNKANSYIPVITLELETKKNIAADQTMQSEKQIDAFQYMMDSEVDDNKAMARPRNLIVFLNSMKRMHYQIVAMLLYL